MSEHFLRAAGKHHHDCDGTTNLLKLLVETLNLLDTLAQHIAEHTHSNTGTPTNASEITQAFSTATALKGKYGYLIS